MCLQYKIGKKEESEDEEEEEDDDLAWILHITTYIKKLFFYLVLTSSNQF